MSGMRKFAPREERKARIELVTQDSSEGYCCYCGKMVCSAIDRTASFCGSHCQLSVHTGRGSKTGYRCEMLGCESGCTGTSTKGLRVRSGRCRARWRSKVM